MLYPNSEQDVIKCERFGGEGQEEKENRKKGSEKKRGERHVTGKETRERS